MITKTENANGPAGYVKKFKRFIEMCRQAKRDDVVTIATPHALGDSYEEIVESLNRLSDAEAILRIVPRSRRGLSKPGGPSPVGSMKGRAAN